jgi:hypothetical protein
MVSAKGMSDEVRQARMGRNLLKQEGTGWDVGAGGVPSAQRRLWLIDH